MKKIFKKQVALLLAILMVIGTLGVAFPDKGTVVQAEDASEDPAYMAKLTDAWIWVYQSVKAEANSVYHFTFDYYVEEGGVAYAKMWRYASTNSSDSSVKVQQRLDTDSRSQMELTYTAEDIDNNVMVRFEGDKAGTVFYVWNVRLTKDDSDENLLSNANFEQGGGSWYGWTIQTTSVKDDTVKSVEGQEIIAFDKSLIPALSYMAKLKGTHVDADDIMHTYVNVYQSETTTVGVKYTFRCKYYDRAADGGASILLWSDASVGMDGADSYGRFRMKTKAATEGTLELTYTATEADSILTAAIECDPESECYFWEISLTADTDPATNLLENADFKEGNGSWIGWVARNVKVNTKDESQALTESYGHEIVEYNEASIEKMKEEDALQKTYADPNTAFQTEQANKYMSLDLQTSTYMAKLNGTYVNANGTTQTYKWAYQGIASKEEVTYHFRFQYSVEDPGVGDSALIAFIQVGGAEVARATLLRGTRGVAELTYKTKTGETGLTIGFYSNPNGTSYIRNVSIFTDTSDENLLQNADFSQGGGSWIGWKLGVDTSISDKATSDVRTETFGHEILPCDWNLFNSDIADWSVRPQLEETLDFTYQTYINESITDIPEMNFVMHDGTEVIKTEQVTGELDTDGKYRFRLEVLPQQMEHQIIGTLNIQTENGEMTQTKQYSVRDYCVSILKDEGCSAELKSLVADLVRYGGQTQAKFGAQDTLASDLESIVIGFGNEDVLADIDDYVAAPVSEEQTGEMYQWKSASLVLNGKVTMRLKFTANDITNLTVKVNNTSYTKDGANKIQANVDGHYYYVDLPVTADSYSECISANFYVDGDETPSGKELSYSVHTYLYRMKDSAKSKDLYQAIYRYGQSAKAYSDYLATGKEDAVVQEEIDNYLFVSEGNASSRMNPQMGGADEEAKTMREAIMNADDTLQTTGGAVYYISATNGDDRSTGTTPETAWKTLAGYRANITQIASGDTVLFERGGVYRGEISDKSILPLVSGVTYGAYGSGAKPAIYGSKQNYTGLGTWTQTDTENIWVCSEAIASDVGTIVFNYGQAVGVKRLKVSNDLATNLAELKSNFEFYHDLETSQLYLYMDCNPSITFYDIEICENSYMLLGSADSEGITIDNLSLKYGGGHAIRFHQGASNITITNCEIGFIGGSLQSNNGETRYGNGIEFWNGCSDITVENNWIYQIYDAGFTHQGGVVGDGSTGYTQEDIVFRSNLVEYCSFGLEFWVGNPETDDMKNILYENNLIRLTGYGWGMVRPSTFGVGAINTWGYSDTFTAEECVIRNNIFDLSTRALMVAYYDTMPAVTYMGNSYYLKEGYVALWQKKKLLRANDEDTMKASVDKIDDNPNVVKFIEG